MIVGKFEAEPLSFTLNLEHNREGFLFLRKYLLSESGWLVIKKMKTIINLLGSNNKINISQNTRISHENSRDSILIKILVNLVSNFISIMLLEALLNLIE